jgi:ATP sulfurylase
MPAKVRMCYYQGLLDACGRPDRVVLSVLVASRRYACSREGDLHPIVHAKYGCTQFVAGRDHSGGSDYCRPFDAQAVSGELRREEIGGTPLLCAGAFYYGRCGAMATPEPCPRGERVRVLLSVPRCERWFGQAGSHIQGRLASRRYRCSWKSWLARVRKTSQREVGSLVESRGRDTGRAR